MIAFNHSDDGLAALQSLSIFDSLRNAGTNRSRLNSTLSLSIAFISSATTTGQYSWGTRGTRVVTALDEATGL